MILILVILFTVFAAKCDDYGTFVVEMPSGGILPRSYTSFKVYWNVPTMQCKSKGIPFPDLYSKYGIIQNKGDRFQGEHITILYDPGRFPALLQNGSDWVYRNGGVPQEGDLEVHLQEFRKTLEKATPESFRGVGIIDFESWRPIFRQNFGGLSPYKDISYDVERKKHPIWPKSWIQDEARRRFEDAGRMFMLSTLELARSLRPHAIWGYYGFPYCFNMSPNNRRQECAAHVAEENDRLSWLWEGSSALFPSLYSSKQLSSTDLQQMVRGRLLEAKRVRNKSKILPYFWYRYRDGGFISEKDLKNSLSILYKSSAAGMMLWGSSNDVNTKAKCILLLDYIDTVLGPTIAKYTKTERTAREDASLNIDYDNMDKDLNLYYKETKKQNTEINTDINENAKEGPYVEFNPKEIEKTLSHIQTTSRESLNKTVKETINSEKNEKEGTQLNETVESLRGINLKVNVNATENENSSQVMVDSEETKKSIQAETEIKSLQSKSASNEAVRDNIAVKTDSGETGMKNLEVKDIFKETGKENLELKADFEETEKEILEVNADSNDRIKEFNETEDSTTEKITLSSASAAGSSWYHWVPCSFCLTLLSVLHHWTHSSLWF